MNRTRAVTLLLAAGFVSGCTDGSRVLTAGRADPNDSPPAERIAFSSSRDGDFEIYVMNPDGSGVRQLTHNRETEKSNAEDDNPAWSPDGSKIAFMSTRDHPSGGVETEEIYVMNADGSDEKRLTTNGFPDFGPRWTSGREIAYTTCREGLLRCELATITVDGKRGKAIDIDDDLVFGYALSPDGSKIAFTRAEGGIEGAFEGRNSDVYVADVDGGNRKRLTESAARESGAAWSPDGRLLAFISDRDKNGPCLWHDCVGFNSEIYVMRADGSHERRLTEHPGQDGLPEWSPDGTRLLFSAFRDGDDFELYMMNADGSCVTQLTRNSAWDWSVDWYWPPEPDGDGRLRC